MGQGAAGGGAAQLGRLLGGRVGAGVLAAGSGRPITFVYSFLDARGASLTDVYIYDTYTRFALYTPPHLHSVLVHNQRLTVCTTTFT